MSCGDAARPGELPSSEVFRSESSRTVIRIGESGGNASSATLRDGRTLAGELGERDGLMGRSWGEGYRICPAPLTPGMLCVLERGMVSDAADRDLVCRLLPERGDVVRGRYGSDAAEELCQDGDFGDVGVGSVDRRSAWSRTRPSSSLVGPVGLCIRRLGSGEGRNSSIRSVSGTGSISAVVTYSGEGRCSVFHGDHKVVRFTLLVGRKGAFCISAFDFAGCREDRWGRRLV